MLRSHGELLTPLTHAPAVLTPGNTVLLWCAVQRTSTAHRSIELFVHPRSFQKKENLPTRSRASPTLKKQTKNQNPHYRTSLSGRMPRELGTAPPASGLSVRQEAHQPQSFTLSSLRSPLCLLHRCNRRQQHPLSRSLPRRLLTDRLDLPAVHRPPPTIRRRSGPQGLSPTLKLRYTLVNTKHLLSKQHRCWLCLFSNGFAFFI